MMAMSIPLYDQQGRRINQQGQRMLGSDYGSDVGELGQLKEEQQPPALLSTTEENHVHSVDETNLSQQLEENKNDLEPDKLTQVKNIGQEVFAQLTANITLPAERDTYRPLWEAAALDPQVLAGENQAEQRELIAKKILATLCQDLWTEAGMGDLLDGLGAEEVMTRFSSDPSTLAILENWSHANSSSPQETADRFVQLLMLLGRSQGENIDIYHGEKWDSLSQAWEIKNQSASGGLAGILAEKMRLLLQLSERYRQGLPEIAPTESNLSPNNEAAPTLAAETTAHVGAAKELVDTSDGSAVNAAADMETADATAEQQVAQQLAAIRGELQQLSLQEQAAPVVTLEQLPAEQVADTIASEAATPPVSSQVETPSPVDLAGEATFMEQEQKPEQTSAAVSPSNDESATVTLAAGLTEGMPTSTAVATHASGSEFSTTVASPTEVNLANAPVVADKTSASSAVVAPITPVVEATPVAAVNPSVIEPPPTFTSTAASNPADENRVSSFMPGPTIILPRGV